MNQSAEHALCETHALVVSEFRDLDEAQTLYCDAPRLPYEAQMNNRGESRTIIIRTLSYDHHGRLRGGSREQHGQANEVFRNRAEAIFHAAIMRACSNFEFCFEH
jgi:hypothetical protein